MRFEYVPIHSLPRLAWCAAFTAGEDTVIGNHGPWLETRDTCFFEAAWNGDFGADAFGEAATILGTGARIDGERMLFSTATDTDFFVYMLRKDDRLIVSNSLVFAMVSAGSRPDQRYPYYLYDFFALRRSGLKPGYRDLRTADGAVVRAYMYGRISVDRRLRVETAPALHHPPPRDFADYVTTLRDAMSSVFDNARDPGRRHPFMPIATLSKGYDSTAVSVLARDLGCRDAVCYSTEPLGYDDNGERNAELLGLEVIRAKQYDFHELPDFPEAEFCSSNPTGAGMPIASLAAELQGRILVKGDSGDFVWSLEEIDVTRNLRRPQIRALATASMNEFRLRTGMLVFDVPAIASIHAGEIQRINRSPEMRPWSIGGEYDRPIPRRIAEEAGIPRGQFGQSKMFGLHIAGMQTTMKPKSLEDFDAYYASAIVPRLFRLHRRPLCIDTYLRPIDWLLRYLKGKPALAGVYKRLALPLLRLTSHRSLDWRRRRPILYLFHWGFEHTRGRYDIASGESR